VIAAASCGLGEAMAGMNVSDLAELPRLASRARPWPDSAGSRFGIRGCGHQRLRASEAEEELVDLGQQGSSVAVLLPDHPEKEAHLFGGRRRDGRSLVGQRFVKADGCSLVKLADLANFLVESDIEGSGGIDEGD
jgi:hypothetical protein